MGEVSIGTQAIAYQPKVRGKVLFYEGHIPMFDFQLSNGYDEWGNILAGNGYLVNSTTTTPLTLSLLECYDVVVISNPTNSFSSSELAAIKEFVGRGRVIAAGAETSSQTTSSTSRTTRGWRWSMWTGSPPVRAAVF